MLDRTRKHFQASWARKAVEWPCANRDAIWTCVISLRGTRLDKYIANIETVHACVSRQVHNDDTNEISILISSVVQTSHMHVFFFLFLISSCPWIKIVCVTIFLLPKLTAAPRIEGHMEKLSENASSTGTHDLSNIFWHLRVWQISISTRTSSS